MQTPPDYFLNRLIAHSIDYQPSSSLSENVAAHLKFHVQALHNNIGKIHV